MLLLPIQPKDALEQVIVPALRLLGQKLDSPEAEVMLLAIALQESGLAHREQIGGPAHGLWQFELGGLRGVFKHASSAHRAEDVASSLGVSSTPEAVYKALPEDDTLAACMARLLLWTDPKALPAVGDEAGAWALYLRTWRPGKPRPDHWHENYRKAVGAVS